jgi:hypothetical protein
MSDDHDVERRLSRYRPAGPSAEFEARLRRNLNPARAPLSLRLPRHAFALAASLLILLSVSFGVAGELERTRLRALMTTESSVSVTEEERTLERELGPEVLALTRQLEAAKAAARSRRDVTLTLDPAAWEKLR